MRYCNNISLTIAHTQLLTYLFRCCRMRRQIQQLISMPCEGRSNLPAPITLIKESLTNEKLCPTRTKQRSQLQEILKHTNHFNRNIGVICARAKRIASRRHHNSEYVGLWQSHKVQPNFDQARTVSEDANLGQIKYIKTSDERAADEYMTEEADKRGQIQPTHWHRAFPT